MDGILYESLAVRTEAPVSEMMARFAANPQTARLDHAGKGLCTEAGEFVDALKRHLVYGEALDPIHLQEELGDVLWYIALANSAINQMLIAKGQMEFVKTIDDIMLRNIDKLRARYPAKFTMQAALERNLTAERTALEKTPTDTAPI